MARHATHKDTHAGKADTLHNRTRQKHRAKAHRELATSFERFMIEHNERQRVGEATADHNERQRSEALNRLQSVYGLEVS